MDSVSVEVRSRVMSHVRGRDTAPEMLVRRLLHGMGYRYRLHGRDLPGRPDLVFRSRQKVVFVHGCFWHLHPRCRNVRLPKSRQDFWLPKLRMNRKRDLANQRRLARAGWDFYIVWECELADLDAVADRLVAFLDGEP